MADHNYGELIRNGLWSNNPSFVQLLGLCPLLAVSSTFANAVGLGLGTTLVLIGSNLTVSMIRNVVRPDVRIPVFVMVIASFVTALELTMNAFFYDLYKALGIFIPLIVTNCVIIGRAEAFASKNGILPSLIDALTMGLGLTFGLALLGALREILGQGTLFAQMDLMFGPLFAGTTLTVISDYQGFLLAMLPPGAFFGLGFLIALKNLIDRRQKRRSAQRPQPSAATQAEAAT